jgi:hypothetical protein
MKEWINGEQGTREKNCLKLQQVINNYRYYMIYLWTYPITFFFFYLLEKWISWNISPKKITITKWSSQLFPSLGDHCHPSVHVVNYKKKSSPFWNIGKVGIKHQSINQSVALSSSSQLWQVYKYLYKHFSSLEDGLQPTNCFCLKPKDNPRPSFNLQI